MSLCLAVLKASGMDSLFLGSWSPSQLHQTRGRTHSASSLHSPIWAFGGLVPCPRIPSIMKKCGAIHCFGHFPLFFHEAKLVFASVWYWAASVFNVCWLLLKSFLLMMLFICVHLPGSMFWVVFCCSLALFESSARSPVGAGTSGSWWQGAHQHPWFL